jgi:hypothetical protein
MLGARKFLYINHNASLTYGFGLVTGLSVTRTTISFAILIFFSFSSLAAVDQLALSFEGEPHTALWADERDSSSAANHGRRVLKRSQRGRSSVKSLPKVDKSAAQIFFISRIRQISFAPRLSKSSVYQQISVYRI